MTAPNRAVIIGISPHLHDALCGVTSGITEVSALLGSVNAAHSDCVKSYGRLIDAIASQAYEMEQCYASLKAAQEVNKELAGAGAAGDAKGAERGAPVGQDVAITALGAPGRPLGSGDVNPLPTEG